MHRTRFPFLALMLVLLVSACSQAPTELSTPTLEPQFGTADNDYGIDVDFASSGRIYSLSQQEGGSYFGDNGFESKVLLDRQDSKGNLVWSITVGSDRYDDQGGGTINALSLVADAQGNVRVLTSHTYWDGDQVEDYYSIISAFNASGRHLSEIRIDENVASWNNVSFAVDGSGNTYVTSTHEYCVEYNDDYFYTCRRYRYEDEVSKYSSSGNLLWQRTSTVGTVKGITVSSTGNVFVVGLRGIARYSSSGTLNWTKTGGGDDITVSGSSVYVRSGKTIRKHDSSGKQLWLKAQSGLSGMVIADMTADGSGNLYLAGTFARTSSDQNAFYRKLNAKGSVVWTKVFGTSKYDDARGIATLNGSEIYVTGSTNGTLSHPNMGGSDGYLRKMDGSGNRIWTR